MSCIGTWHAFLLRLLSKFVPTNFTMCITEVRPEEVPDLLPYQRISAFWTRGRIWCKNCKLEKACFLGEFELKPCSQTRFIFSKRSGNNWKRKRKPRTFQNFKNYEKILIIKKVPSILVSIGTIFTCLSVNPTFNDYIPYCYLVRPRSFKTDPVESNYSRNWVGFLKISNYCWT